MAETQVEGVDEDAEAVTTGMVEVVVVVAVAVVGAVAAGVVDAAFAATTMLKERLVIRRPSFAVTRNWTTWRSAVGLAKIWTATP
jgi:hypothetical protein